MILQALLTLLFDFVNFVFSLFPDLPQVPTEFSHSIDVFFDTIFSGIGLFGILVRPLTLTLIIPIVILLINFDKIWSIIMWVVRKIPFLGSE